jgi:hypothetical protein
MTKAPKITSTYAIVDVMKGRRALRRYLEANGPLRVTIVAELTEPYGGDDGVSIEFNANILSITKQPAQAIEARRAETQSGSVHESAVPQGCAQKDIPHDSK